MVDYSNVSTDELMKIYLNARRKVSTLNAMQMAVKVRINGIYGAVANEHFRHFRFDNAEAITMSGQLSIRWAGKAINEYMNEKLGTSDLDYLAYTDTDSCEGSTLITVNGEQVTIADFYNIVQSKERLLPSGTQVKEVGGCTTPSVGSDLSITESPLLYVAKHKVKKKAYRIKANGREVIVTEDHSVMVVRDGVLVDVKPADIKKGDSIVIE